MSRFRVLHISDRWENGGIEKLISSILSHSSGSPIAHTVLSVCSPKVEVADIQLEPALVSEATIVGKIKGALRLDAFLATHRYQVVHIHTTNALGLYYAHLAKKHGIAVRVVHSHISRLSSQAFLLKMPMHWVGRRLFGYAPTDRWACSTEAGIHLFNKRSFEVIKNAIDTERFKFNPASRTAVRRRLGISEDALVVGSIGRLSAQKNPLFLIDVFAEISKRDPRARFILVGEGELRESVEERMREMDLGSTCHIVGYTRHPEEQLNAMDVFVAPSLYEGLPIALVEAQASGLTVVASDAISAETIVSEDYRSLSLELPAAEWAAAATAAFDPLASRANAYRCVEEAGFSIGAVVNQIESSYLDSLEEARR